RYTKTLIFCFDRDAAGLNAAKRGMTIARAQNFDVRAIIMSEDVKDPDDLVQKNPEAWAQLAKHSVPVMEYLIERTLAGKNLTKVDDKRAIAKELLPFIQEIKDVVEQEHWLQVVGNLLAVEPATLRTSIRQTETKNKSNTNRVQEVKKPAVPAKHTKEEGIVTLLLGVLINNAQTLGGYLQELSIDASLQGLERELYNQARDLYTGAQNTPDQTLFSRLRDHFDAHDREDLKQLLIKLSLLADRTFSQLSPAQVEDQVKTLCALLGHSESQRKRKIIATKIRQAEQLGDQEAVQKLLSELSQ
ncbi:MAG: toprim domain-containing protein, partial [Patescibacteria group bacterium]